MANIEFNYLDSRFYGHGLKCQIGVTLIELLITVAILGILAAVAVPSYQEYIRQGNRAEAKGILLETAQFLERNYTTASRYDQDSAGNATALPYATSPKPGSGTAKYNIAADYTCDTAGQCFSLSATRIAGGSMDGDGCGTFVLTNTGAQTLANNTLTVADCWQR